MVPLLEELFWRSFLLRYATDARFKTVPLGKYSTEAFAIVAVIFGLAHSKWLAAILTACIYALLPRQTRNLLACVVAHGVTNLSLGVYVVAARDWVYW